MYTGLATSVIHVFVKQHNMWLMISQRAQLAPRVIIRFDSCLQTMLCCAVLRDRFLLRYTLSCTIPCHRNAVFITAFAPCATHHTLDSSVLPDLIYRMSACFRAHAHEHACRKVLQVSSSASEDDIKKARPLLMLARMLLLEPHVIDV